VTLVWPSVPEPIAGYLVRYGESADQLTRTVAAGPLGWITLTDLMPGTSYVARITAHDFNGREGPGVDVNFTTPGTPVERPTFALSAGSPSLAPGSIATIEGTRLSNIELAAASARLPFSLGGTTVHVNGVAAPLVSVSSARVSFVVPWEVVGTEALLTVAREGIAAADRRVPVTTARPWIATWPDDGLAVAAHADGSLVSMSAPIAHGETADILAAGLGFVLPLPDNGVPAGGPHAARVQADIEARIGGAAATVIGAWLLPGSVATYGIRISIPESASAGAQSLEISVGGERANIAWIPIK
jgi:uncharacterized protein (TIGR03437 family)